jgi:26S proteasome regulatory subunit N11
MDIQALLGQMGGAQNREPQGPAPDVKQADKGEQVYISSLALLKMIKHCKAGVPFEVMGLMVGEFVDQYTISVVDVFAMPQSGTTVSVETVDEAYQSQFLDMWKQVGRMENVVGWYHSHPGFGPWLSGTDIQTQRSFEMMSSNFDNRAVGVVLDPI